LGLRRGAVLRFPWFTSYSATPSHQALPWADDRTLPDREVRCAPQQNFLSIGSYGSKAADQSRQQFRSMSVLPPRADIVQVIPIDSSSTMMMCGGLSAGRQVSPER